MTRAAGEYLVYSCEHCAKRIFTERSHLGRTGKCPMCGAKHVVGGTRVAQEGDERRRAPRVKDERAKVELKGKAGRTSPVLAEELLPMGDLSETGISFKLAGVSDHRQLKGYRPPALKIGDVVEVTLHSPDQFRPHPYKAEVRRVEELESPQEKGSFLVGTRFVGLTPKQIEELKVLVEKLSGQDKL